ncbi:proton-conducting transporter transmembrane domain-containing protein [Humibacter ginsenosidimutans]|uniref:NADH dehydrogenase FAD-containing subunit n=1 Tax=Humibacter ginsenosidimutans TaxID=2599293 RepID=A0A5B8M0Z2_9MICO|nr:proton-conducting transporter membrane subunit [Humibacter ginsenosidimutans]QDZ14337.1 NADH dehydrogenase FAD-containing subunit [Humibacter ginsenosidimutans]
MSTMLLCVFLLPLGMTLLSFLLPRRVTEMATIVVGVATFVLAVSLMSAVTHGVVTAPPFLRVDALSEIFLLATAFLYPVTAIYTIGYFAKERSIVAHDGADAIPQFRRYSRLFYLGFNAFAWSMICAPIVNGLALLWIAIEITTVVSALLVAIDRTDGATEAAWKYVLIASCGLGIGLLATIILYYAGSTVLGDSYDLGLESMLRSASRLPAVPVQLAFGLAVIGYGTKVGLFPVHTWLPDAHSEAPTPISALLSGALLATSFYAILRYYQIAVGALGPAFPQNMLLIFGVLSLLLAALYLFAQRNIKRMLAYSSVEHMGILAIGVSFGAPIAFAGVLLHVLAHAAAKGTAFMGAGTLVHKYGTKEMSGMRGAIRALPFSGPIFLIAIFTLGALPPFGMFRSEFQIVSGGVSSGHGVVGAVLVILLSTAFLGLMFATTRVLFEPGTSTPLPSSEPSYWMVVPTIIGVVALLVLGVHPPDTLVDLLTRGAAELTGAAS